MIQLIKEGVIEKYLSGSGFGFWLQVSEDTEFVVRICIEGAGPPSTVSSGVRFLRFVSVGNQLMSGLEP